MQLPVGSEETGHAPRVMDWPIHTESNAFNLERGVSAGYFFYVLFVQTLKG